MHGEEGAPQSNHWISCRDKQSSARTGSNRDPTAFLQQPNCLVDRRLRDASLLTQIGSRTNMIARAQTTFIDRVLDIGDDTVSSTWVSR
jgi:hypothetical protein